jgi:hypothetical protein
VLWDIRKVVSPRRNPSSCTVPLWLVIVCVSSGLSDRRAIAPLPTAKTYGPPAADDTAIVTESPILTAIVEAAGRPFTVTAALGGSGRGANVVTGEHDASASALAPTPAKHHAKNPRTFTTSPTNPNACPQRNATAGIQLRSPR